MENTPGQSPYKKVGMAVSAISALMIIGFLAFVYYDAKLSKDHSAEAPQVEQVKADDHAASSEGHGNEHKTAEPAKEGDH